MVIEQPFSPGNYFGAGVASSSTAAPSSEKLSVKIITFPSETPDLANSIKILKVVDLGSVYFYCEICNIGIPKP